MLGESACLCKLREILWYVSGTSTACPGCFRAQELSGIVRNIICGTFLEIEGKKSVGDHTLSSRFRSDAFKWDCKRSRWIFPVVFPLVSGKIWLGRRRKNPESSCAEYCFHEYSGIARNRPFPCRMVRPGSDSKKFMCKTIEQIY